MDHVAGPLHILLGEKEGRIWFNIICLQIYQFERTTWWCLSDLESVLESILKSIMESALKSILLKNVKKIMVSRNLCQAHLLEVLMTKILGDHKTLSIVRHVGLRVDFSSMKSSLGL